MRIMEFIDTTTLTTIAGGTLVFTGTMASIYLVIKLISNMRKKRHDKSLIDQNVIPIIHNNPKQGIYRIFDSENMIDVNAHTNFIKMYNKLDKDKDIHLIIHTLGGSLSSAEAICNCMISHRGKGKIYCYVPYYAYSGGLLIALFSDKIFVLENTIFGPCDGQQMIDKFKYYSITSIISTVEYKKENKEPIKELWLASYEDAKNCRLRQRKFIGKLKDNYDHETLDKIYEEFLSGKYNHDKIFSAQDMVEIGVNIEIVDQMPTFVDDIMSKYI